MKISKTYFKVPMKIYDSIELGRIERSINSMLDNDLNVHYEYPEGIISYGYISPDMIIGIIPILPVVENTDGEIKRCELHLTNGKIIPCLWSPDKTLAKLDAFYDEFQEANEDEVVNNFVQKLENDLANKLNNVKINTNNQDDTTTTNPSGTTRKYPKNSKD